MNKRQRKKLQKKKMEKLGNAMNELIKSGKTLGESINQMRLTFINLVLDKSN